MTEGQTYKQIKKKKKKEKQGDGKRRQISGNHGDGVFCHDLIFPPTSPNIPRLPPYLFPLANRLLRAISEHAPVPIPRVRWNRKTGRNARSQKRRKTLYRVRQGRQ